MRAKSKLLATLLLLLFTSGGSVQAQTSKTEMTLTLDGGKQIVMKGLPLSENELKLLEKMSKEQHEMIVAKQHPVRHKIAKYSGALWAREHVLEPIDHFGRAYPGAVMVGGALSGWASTGLIAGGAAR